MSTKVMVWSRVDPEVKELAEKVSDAQGLTISEYIRMLITNDLDKRTFFTDQVKKEINA